MSLLNLSPTLLLALLLNLGLLLLLSWGFFLLLLGRHQREKRALVNKVSALLQERAAAARAAEAIDEEPLADDDQDLDLNADYPSGMDETVQGCRNFSQQAEQSWRELEQNALQQRQQLDQAIEMAAQDDPDNEATIARLRQQLAMMKVLEEQNNNIVSYLENQIKGYRSQLAALEQRTDMVKAHAKRTSSLERQQRQLRRELSRLRTNNLASAHEETRKLVHENQHLHNRLEKYEEKHRKSEEQVIILRRSLEQMKQTMASTQHAMEERQRSQLPVDDYAIDELRSELENTRREKQFLEEQYLELLEGPDGLVAVTEQLERVQREHAMLEMSYLEMFEEAASNNAANNKTSNNKVSS